VDCVPTGFDEQQFVPVYGDDVQIIRALSTRSRSMTRR
jgi:hypothetical protein